MDDADLQLFEDTRPRLLGLAYRILGSRADAEDAVQDCFLKWREADRTQITTPTAWLSTVCTRRCLDILRAADRMRIDYVGPWLPEPIHPATPPAADSKLAASLTTAFLLLLERLTPKERAVYLAEWSGVNPKLRR
jgi:RNA polymerase sigma-70 factor (ECF subfamily)